MLQNQKLVQLTLSGTILLGLLVAVYLVAWRRFARPATAAVVKHPVSTPPDEAIRYWTADKMRGAKPVEMPKSNAIKHKKKKHAGRHSHSSHPKHS